MHIQLESNKNNSIQGYSDHLIKINGIEYSKSLIVSPDSIITEFNVQFLKDLHIEHLRTIINQNPEVIIIGHQENLSQSTLQQTQHLLNNNHGIELMPLGAACRTFNVLLGEHRNVFGVFIIQNNEAF